MSTEKSITHRIEAMSMIARNIDRILASVQRKDESHYTTAYLRDKLQKLSDCWSRANQYHIELKVAVSDEERETVKYFSEKVFDNMESSYEETEEFISSCYYARYKERENAQNETQYVMANSSVAPSNVKLPRIDLPKFSGDYHQWTSFKDVYTSIIHDNSSITSVQKFQYLMSSVDGEARALISALSLTHDNYKVAWNALTARYENKRMIVTSLLAKLFAIKAISSEHTSELKSLRNEYTLVLDSLQTMKVPTSQWDPLIVFLLTQKFNRNLRQSWEELLSDDSELPTLDKLTKFLDGKIRMETSLLKCWLCSNCLSKHPSTECNSKVRCRKCNTKHHTLLHADNRVIHGDASKSTCNEQVNVGHPRDKVNVHLNSAHATSVLLATARVCLLSPSGERFECRALFDQGSEATFITEYVAQRLALPRSKVHVSVSGLGGNGNAIVKRTALISLASRYDNTTYVNVNALVMRKITSYRPHSDTDIPYHELEGIDLADPHPEKCDRIDILLGADIYGSLLRRGIKRLSINGMIAQNTAFGWILSGPIKRKCDRVISVNHASFDELDSILQAFWDVENVPTRVFESEDEARCEQYFVNTTSREPDGRFVVRLPFIANAPVLGESKRRAIASFYSAKRQHARNVKLNAMYHDFLSEYETLGHMSPVEFESDKQYARTFLPHHGVLREDKSTTKLRVVFNASSKTDNGLSLNDVLCIGPKLQTDITGILFNWRLHQYVISADIKKMFRQILVDKRDRRFQCIIWHRTDSTEPQEFELNTVTYGTGPAPFLAMRVIKELALSCEAKFPLAARVLRENIYVDYVLFGSDDKAVLIQIRDQLNDALKTGGFVLKKWASNSRDVLTDFESNQSESLRDIESSPTFKVLGVNWNVATDAFELHIPYMNFLANTKRTVLSSIASLYDPMGWCSPVVVRGKCLLQSLWLLKVDWDSKLPENITRQWSEFVSDVNHLQATSIPRWIGYTTKCKAVELIGFSDASLSAYSAVVYLRVTDAHDVRKVTLLMAKSKVAPLKVLSIPRLELCGALLLSNLIIHVRKLLSVTVTITHCYTDSKIVLAWLRKPSYTWTTFVANRVSSIQTELPDATWRHVRSRDNPADLNSRGISADELKRSKLWWSGPVWINSDLTRKGASELIPSTNLEVKPSRIHSLIVTTEPWDVISRFESWTRLVRVMAYVLRFVKRTRRLTPDHDPSDVLYQGEIIDAQNTILREMQRFAFPDEFKDLKQTSTVSSRSRLFSLHPYLDENGIIRVGGCLSRSVLSRDAKNPVILQANMHSDIVIRYYHIYTLHGGLQLTLRALRERFWILNARSRTKAAI